MNKEYLFIYLLLCVSFIYLIIFPRSSISKNVQNYNSVNRYKKLNLLNGTISELTSEKMQSDVSALLDEGYELTTLQELFDLVENKNKISKRFLLILNNEIAKSFIETISYQLTVLNTDVIIYKLLKIKHK